MANVKGRAGVVGLGMIGGGIAESLIRSGFVPVVGDICAERMQAFAGRAVLAKSAAEVAAQSDVVMVCVVNALQARAVICGEEGLLSSKHSGLIVCLVSTLSRREVLELNAVCEGAGVHLLDCGVSPGYLAAQNGMAAMVGGSADAVECARAVIEGWAKKLIYCGEIGAGMAVKLARNVFTFGCWRVGKEAQALVESAGGSAATLLDAITTSDPDGALPLNKLRRASEEGKLPKDAAEKNYMLMQKDLAAAFDLASERGVAMPASLAAMEYARDTLDYDRETEDVRERGIQTAECVYGGGMGERLATRTDSVYAAETLDRVFAEVWHRPSLAVSAKRLIVMGVAAAQGRGDLIKIQMLGALRRGELTEAQIDDLVLLLSYYVGWCNAGSVAQGAAEAVAAFKREGSNEYKA